MTKRLLCGIDVGSKELVVAIDPGSGPLWEGAFRNDAAGHRQLIRRLTRRPASARVCVEATGIYPLDRSEERRVGKECTSWCRSRWSPYH